MQIEDQIKRKQIAVDRINEKAFKANIRTVMLGKDADRNEYWHFKEDCDRIYVRKEFVAEVAATEQNQSQENSEQAVIETRTEVKWYYLDEEAKLDQLIESLNIKGIRERKLLEGIKKCRDRLKLKKAKKVSMNESAADQTVEKKDDEGNQDNDSPTIQRSHSKVPSQADQGEDLGCLFAASNLQ